MLQAHGRAKRLAAQATSYLSGQERAPEQEHQGAQHSRRARPHGYRSLTPLALGQGLARSWKRGTNSFDERRAFKPKRTN